MAEANEIMTSDMEEYQKERENLITIAKATLYFACNSKAKLYKTKLHQLLFYTQFLYFREHNEKLFSFEFVRGFGGPVMEDMDEVLLNLEEAGIIALYKNKCGVYIEPLVKLKDADYEPSELKILRTVNEKFSYSTIYDVYKSLVYEPLLKETAAFRTISLRRADELCGI